MISWMCVQDMPTGECIISFLTQDEFRSIEECPGFTGWQDSVLYRMDAAVGAWKRVRALPRFT